MSLIVHLLGGHRCHLPVTDCRQIGVTSPGRQSLVRPQEGNSCHAHQQNGGRRPGVRRDRHVRTRRYGEDQNIRAVELDLFPDPQGGLYTYPLIRKMADKGPLTDPDLAKPGIKVLHWADFDYGTTCTSFVKCLTQVKTWSNANPDHAPIIIQLELKQSDPRLVAAGGVEAPPWDAGNLDSIDREIRSVFSENRDSFVTFARSGLRSADHR